MGNTNHGMKRKQHLKLAASSEPTSVSASERSADTLAIFNFLSAEIEDRMGADFLAKMPLDLLEPYCLATARQNEPTAALLYELMTNFMKAYANPESNSEALKAFDYLAHLADPQS